MTFAFDHYIRRRENPITEPIEVVRQEIIDQWISAPVLVSDQQISQEGLPCCMLEQPQGDMTLEALQTCRR